MPLIVSCNAYAVMLCDSRSCKSTTTVVETTCKFKYCSCRTLMFDPRKHIWLVVSCVLCGSFVVTTRLLAHIILVHFSLQVDFGFLLSRSAFK